MGEQRPPARFIIICGLPFAGKTTLGNAICARYGLRQVDVDVVKAEFYGDNREDLELTPAMWDRIYQVADDRVRACLAAGESVLDSSRYFLRRERDRARTIACEEGAELVLIHVDTPEAITRDRLASNRPHLTRRDIDDAAFEDLVRFTEAPHEDERPLVYSYQDELETWITTHHFGPETLQR